MRRMKKRILSHLFRLDGGVRSIACQAFNTNDETIENRLTSTNLKRNTIQLVMHTAAKSERMQPIESSRFFCDRSTDGMVNVKIESNAVLFNFYVILSFFV